MVVALLGRIELRASQSQSGALCCCCGCKLKINYSAALGGKESEEEARDDRDDITLHSSVGAHTNSI